MKQIFFFFFFFLALSIGAYAQKSKNGTHFITGNIKGYNSGYIYLITYNNKNERIKDSCKLSNGKFRFENKINIFSERNYIKLDGNQYDNNDSVNAVQLFLDNSNSIIISLVYGHFSKYKITGCHACEMLSTYNKGINKITQHIDYYWKKERGTIDLEAKEKYMDSSDNYYLLRQKKAINYCEKNPNSPIAAWLILENYVTDQALSNLYVHLSQQQQHSYYGSILKQKSIDRANMIGAKALPFSTKDINNITISLDSFKNKYMLLDFWASWCVPCRAGNPSLIKSYEKYHSLGFEIIGISSDDDEIKWREAVAHDSINIWRHCLSRYKSSTDIGDLYKIEALPTQILIDKNGVIIERYSDGNNEALPIELKKIFASNSTIVLPSQ